VGTSCWGKSALLTGEVLLQNNHLMCRHESGNKGMTAL
jgi:hypothetical protein